MTGMPGFGPVRVGEYDPAPVPIDVYYLPLPANMHAFLWERPTAEQYAGEVRPAKLIRGEASWHDWPDGADSPTTCLGVADDGYNFQVFRSVAECGQTGYRRLGPNYMIYTDWNDFNREHHDII